MLRLCFVLCLFFFVPRSVVSLLDKPVETPQNDSSVLKVGFIYNGDLLELWTFEHDQGRYAIANTFRREILTSAIPAVNELDFEASTLAIEQLINTGHKVVITASSGFEAATKAAAARYPDHYFLQVPGVSTDNLTNYVALDVRSSDVYYLIGLLSGLMTKTNRIGIITGFPGIFTSIRSINAVAIGAYEVNQDVIVEVIYMFSWTDNRLHRQAAEQLLADSADIIISLSGSTVPDQTVAKESATGREIYSAGFAGDFRVWVGPSVISSQLLLWSKPYSDFIASILNKTFKAESVFLGLPDGAIDLAPLSDVVPLDKQQIIYKRRLELLRANEETVFCGPLIGPLRRNPTATSSSRSSSSSKKKQTTSKDTCLSQAEVLDMSAFVDIVTVIPGEFYFNDVYMEEDSAPAVILFAVGGLCVGITAGYAFFTFIFRETAIIRYASPFFCMLILIGGFIQYVSGFLILVKPTDVTCMAAYWFYGVGFVMILSCILAKNYRVWKIFRRVKRFKVASLPITVLLAILGVAVGIELVFLIIWTAVAPLEQNYESDPDTLNDDERYVQCRGESWQVFIILQQVYFGILMFFLVILAFLTRKVEGVFKETTSISLAVYNVVVFQVVILPIIYLLDDDQYEASTSLLAISFYYPAISTLTLLFIPKIFIALFQPSKNKLGAVGDSTLNIPNLERASNPKRNNAHDEPGTTKSNSNSGSKNKNKRTSGSTPKK